jgi:hypothetical protein
MRDFKVYHAGFMAFVELTLTPNPSPKVGEGRTLHPQTRS